MCMAWSTALNTYAQYYPHQDACNFFGVETGQIEAHHFPFGRNMERPMNGCSSGNFVKSYNTPWVEGLTICWEPMAVGTRTIHKVISFKINTLKALYAIIGLITATSYNWIWRSLRAGHPQSSGSDYDNHDLSHLLGAALREDQAQGPAPLAHRDSPTAQQPLDEPEQGVAMPPSDDHQAAYPDAAAQPMETDQAGGAAHESCDLPPQYANPPPGESDPEAQRKVAKWLDLQSQGRSLASQLRASRDYRNPEFFSKMVEYWEIDQYGTAFNSEVYDPTSLPAEDRIQALQEEWAQEETRRRTVRAATGRVEFTKGGVQPGNGPSAAAAAAVAAAHAKAAALAAAAHMRRWDVNGSKY